MGARYLLVDVFAREPLAGNALAVFPDPGSVRDDRMQQIAREMNLSETTFVTGLRVGGYDVRIFTPTAELPFAGHPTLGTAWVLRHLGALDGDEFVQRSPAGETPVTWDGERMWLERGGSAGDDLDDVATMLDVLRADPSDVGFDAAEIGGPSRALRPAIADAGVPIPILPFADPSVVASLAAPSSLGSVDGVYCIAPFGRGRIKARFFGAGFGVIEDPATGAACAALGLYLGHRVGEISVEVEQGAEIARPSFLSLEASPGRARVGGPVRPSAEATLVA